MTTARNRQTYMVAIICNGEREVHIADPSSNWASLCGMDGYDDDKTVNQSISKDKPDDKINCVACRNIWEACRRIRESDFEEATQ